MWKVTCWAGAELMGPGCREPIACIPLAWVACTTGHVCQTSGMAVKTASIFKIRRNVYLVSVSKDKTKYISLIPNNFDYVVLIMLL